MPNRARFERSAITIVAPVLNEERHIAALMARLDQALDGLNLDWSVLFIDDGSADATLATIRALAGADHRVGAIALSRNFGKEAAIAAGLRYAQGQAIILMDCDLQHPPEVIPQFIQAWRAGACVVLGSREDRPGDGLARRGLSRFFYRLFGLISDTPIPDGATDFVLLDRKAVRALNSLGESCRFSKGLFAWIGFKSATVPFSVAARDGDASRWSLFKLLKFALDGLASFSSLPLKIWSYLGFAISIAAIAYSVFFWIRTLAFGVDMPGFPSLMVSITFFAGVQFISLGVLGEYLARVYSEVKARPLYIVAEEIGLNSNSRLAEAG